MNHSILAGLFLSLVSAFLGNTAQASPNHAVHFGHLEYLADGQTICLYDVQGRLIGLDENRVNPHAAMTAFYEGECENIPQAQFKPEMGNANSAGKLENIAHPDFCTPFSVKEHDIVNFLPKCIDVIGAAMQIVKGQEPVYTYQHRSHIPFGPIRDVQIIEFDVVSADKVYTDTPVTVKLTSLLDTFMHRQAVYEVAIWANGQIVGTKPIQISEKGIQIDLNEYFDFYVREVIFELRANPKDKQGRPMNPASHGLTSEGPFEYIAHAENFFEESARVGKPWEAEFWAGFVVSAGVTVVDFFTEDIYACVGAEASFIGYDLSENNRLLSCSFAALDLIQVGDIVKLSKEGKTIVKGAKVAKVTKSQSKVYLELAPMTDESLEAAYKSKSKIPTPSQAFTPVRFIRVNNKTFQVSKRFHTDSKWLAHFTKHGDRLNVRTHETYLGKAFEFSTQQIDNVVTFRKQDASGKVFTYNRNSQELSVVSKQGDILSYYIVNSTEANRLLVSKYNAKVAQGKNPRPPVPYRNAWDYYLRQGLNTSGILSN